MSKARQLADLGNVYDDGALSNRNLIINGAMQVAQRGTSDVTGLTQASDGYKTVDRWRFNANGGSNTGQITMSFETDAPNDFKYSTKYLVTTADTDIGTDGDLRLETHLEAQNLRHLNFGSSNAKQLTLSFWVKSNKIGNYSAGLYMDSASNSNNQISQGYTINASGTWEYKTLTFVGNTGTTMNTTDNDHGLRVWFFQAAGSDYKGESSNTWGGTSHRAIGQDVNLYDTVNNYFQITGVQLEVGDTATPFEHRSYGDELARCQRYFLMCKPETSAGITHAGFANLNARSTTARYSVVHFPVSMRVRPSVAYSGSLTAYSGSGSYAVSAISMNGSTEHAAEMEITAASGATVGHGGWVRILADAYVEFDSEL